MNPDIQQISSLALSFKQAIKSIDHDDRPNEFLNFPRGCCGNTSRMFGIYLASLNINCFQYISASRGCHGDGDYQSHAWLQCDDLYIDLTAEQFADGPQELVLIDSVWHTKFELEDEPSFTSTSFLYQLTPELRAFHELVVSKIS